MATGKHQERIDWKEMRYHLLRCERYINYIRIIRCFKKQKEKKKSDN